MNTDTTTDTAADPLNDGMPNDEVDGVCIELRDVEALLRAAFDQTGDSDETAHLLIGVAQKKVAAALESLNRYV